MMDFLFIGFEISFPFELQPTLQTLFLLGKIEGQHMLGVFCAFEVTTVVLPRRRLGAASSNYTPCFTCGFESLLVANVSHSFHNTETRKDEFYHPED